MKNRNLPVDDNWATPDDFYAKLDAEFNFDFDPCPYYVGEVTPDRDGLLIPWAGVSVYVNPPYSRQIKEAFVKRGIEESRKGKTVVFLLPVSTSTDLFHNHILPNAAEIRFVHKRLKFKKQLPDGSWTTPHGGMHDSMIVVFKDPFSEFI